MVCERLCCGVVIVFVCGAYCCSVYDNLYDDIRFVCSDVLLSYCVRYCVMYTIFTCFVI